MVDTKIAFVNNTESEQEKDSLLDFAFSLLAQAATLAVVPVSDFRVGAIAIDERNNLYPGANQEYAGACMAQTVHAEQSAIANAWSQGARAIRHIVVNHTPCGHCRQFMNELRDADQLQIHLPHSRGNHLSDYLPDSFGPADLDMTGRILDRENHSLTVSGITLDRLGDMALAQARKSYAPYGGAYAGICLQDRAGQLYTGAYLENAAFNPSLPPLQMALNALHLAGKRVEDIVAGTLVRVAGHGQAAHAQALWHTISKVPLNVLAVD